MNQTSDEPGVSGLVKDAKKELFGSNATISTLSETSEERDVESDIKRLLEAARQELLGSEISSEDEAPALTPVTSIGNVVTVPKSTVITGMRRLNRLKKKAKVKGKHAYRYLKCGKSGRVPMKAAWWENPYIESCARTMLLTKNWTGLTRVLLLMVRQPKYMVYVEHVRQRGLSKQASLHFFFQVLRIMLNSIQDDAGVDELLEEFEQLFHRGTQAESTKFVTQY